MIEIKSKKNKFTYNVYHVTKAFFPEEEIVQTVDEEQEPLVWMQLPGGACFSLAERSLTMADRKMTLEEEQTEKREVTRQVYRFLSEECDRELAWGMLTGVRPTKLVMQKLEDGMDQAQIKRFLEEEYCVTKEKAELAYEIACREKEQLGKLDVGEGFSLYVGIPFCPSICSYCSFSSSPVGEWKDKIDAYLDALIKELKALGRMAGERKPDTVYVGGGTPTTLEAGQLDRLLGTIRNYFDLSELKEFTVEAGRPDSITREKLEVVRRYPVTRISVNPQTMQQKTLDLIGRKHTVEQTKEAFHLARGLGFDNINMDLIMGLPGENLDDVKHTLEEIEALKPDSLTVHSLAIKRAARLNMFKEEYADLKINNTPEMIALSEACARRMGMEPYYLYRQKNMAGNFENVGYSLPGKACIYNILIMEEMQTIAACGAGTTTKVVFPSENRRERCENVKEVEQYISRIDEMIGRKEKIIH
mgnify:CR=1 FL=1